MTLINDFFPSGVRGFPLKYLKLSMRHLALLRMNPYCRFCLRILQMIPVVFILCVFVWSYYAFVFELCFLEIESVPKRVFYLSVFHILIGLFMWAYVVTIFTSAWQPPAQFKLKSSDARRVESEDSDDAQRHLLLTLAKHLPVSNRTMSGNVRYCETCRAIKPDRCHHCSVCGFCVLKMDHHCPWVNNCVAFSTYKFFVLFLFYSMTYCGFIALTSMPHFVHFWKQGKTSSKYWKSDRSVETDLEEGPRFHLLFLFFVSIMFTISLCILFTYHCFLVLVNRTTLEAFRPPIFRTGPDKSGYNLGNKKNFFEIFGDDPRLWAFPVFTSRGDGVSFPLRKFRDEEERLGLLTEHRHARWEERGGGDDDGDDEEEEMSVKLI